MKEDTEGRVIACEMPNYVLVAVYTPHSGVGDLKRLEYRVETWDKEFTTFL
jgi:exonuclease III